MAYRVVTLCVAEGVATYFISAPPAGRAPAFPDAPFRASAADLAEAWYELVAREEEIFPHLTAWLDRALAGALTEDAFTAELRDYWLNGAVGRAYILGAERFGAIYTAFGKEGILLAMRDPRRLFSLHNAALDEKPEALKCCVRIPDKAAKQALPIGGGRASAALPLPDDALTSPA